MELWIRSQNRECLVKAHLITIDDDRIVANFESHYGGCNYVILGDYQNNHRALEVLDEIIKCIDGTMYDMRNKNCVVYEMPRD